MDIAKHNQAAWDGYVEKKDKWTRPVTGEDLENAGKGRWGILLTPSKPVPHHWFPKLKGLRVLGLASGGGQQGPILAALGADVTIFDNSEKQLMQDRMVSEHHNLNIKTVQGDMRDLSVFDTGTFDLVFNPCSIVFVPDVKPVWQECSRVLRHGGILMSGLINPVSFQLLESSKGLILHHKQPYTDLHSLPEEKLRELINSGEALEFGHSLTDQVGGQLEAGLVLTDMYEDQWGDGQAIDGYLPAFIATRSVKPTNI
jgi:2-polyprenyl-3-methyl-5-hydroxy-6-metoxy-1,4-benzoquinol methylase